jgi:outer membrane protein OmpA-like peptidoglycan-associated protein
MRDSCRIPRGRELLTITYDGHVFFECKSATLKPGGRAELGRVANVINLFPEMAVHVEVILDSGGLQANGHGLQQARVRAVKDALLRQGLNASGVQTTIHRTSSTLTPEDTVSVKVIDRLIAPFRQAQAGCQIGGQPYRQAC